MITEVGLGHEAGHRLGDVDRVDPVVIWVGGVIVTLHGGEELPDNKGIEAEVVQEAQLPEQVRAHRG